MQASYDIINYSTFICPFQSGKWKGRDKNCNICNLKNKNNFLVEMKSIVLFIDFEGLLFSEKITQSLINQIE